MIGPSTDEIDSSTTPGSPQGFSLYCFTRPAIVERLSLPETDGVNSVESLEIGGIAAVYSRVSCADFTGPKAEAHFQDLDWLAPRAWRHEKVIEAVMALAPVLPVQFGAIFSTCTSLTDSLVSRTEVIRRFLDHMDGKEEWSVKVFLEMSKLSQWLEATDPILKMRRSGLSEARGTRYFQEKQLQKDVQQQGNLWAKSLAGLVAEALRDETDDACILKRRSRDEFDRKMVGHQAFLLHRSKVSEFQRQIERIGLLYADRGVTIESIGPWPPFNFCPRLDDISPG